VSCIWLGSRPGFDADFRFVAQPLMTRFRPLLGPIGLFSSRHSGQGILFTLSLLLQAVAFRELSFHGLLIT
jgi:hypothetical protein